MPPIIEVTANPNGPGWAVTKFKQVVATFLDRQQADDYADSLLDDLRYSAEVDGDDRDDLGESPDY